jgi:hypothetical protein
MSVMSRRRALRGGLAAVLLAGTLGTVGAASASAATAEVHRYVLRSDCEAARKQLAAAGATVDRLCLKDGAPLSPFFWKFSVYR